MVDWNHGSRTIRHFIFPDFLVHSRIWRLWRQNNLKSVCVGGGGGGGQQQWQIGGGGHAPLISAEYLFSVGGGQQQWQIGGGTPPYICRIPFCTLTDSRLCAFDAHMGSHAPPFQKFLAAPPPLSKIPGSAPDQGLGARSNGFEAHPRT